MKRTIVLALAMLFPIVGPAGPASAAVRVITVTTSGDLPDLTAGTGTCDVSSFKGLQCSLRAAIQTAEANANDPLGPDRIEFRIGSGIKTIRPGSALPTITEAVVILGSTQPGTGGTTCLEQLGHPCIEVDGTNAGEGFVPGFRLNASNSRISDLVINNFSDAGIVVSGDANTIRGNFLGLDATGTSARPNFSGLIIVANATGNLIGGSAAGAGNVISGNLDDGIRAVSGDNLFFGNLIGLSADGASGIGNGGDGIDLPAGAGNAIGGPGNAGNVISANTRGISVGEADAPDAPLHLIQGNLIGTDVTGLVDLGNEEAGIVVAQGRALIGGSAAGEGNVIAGNGVGVRASGEGTRIVGNDIGLGADGRSLGNDAEGILAGGPIAIGGSTPEASNAVASNGGVGIRVANGTGARILQNSIFGNAGIGIDLGVDGVTPNDDADVDTGPNDLQNFPVLTSAVAGSSSTLIKGRMNATPSTTFTVRLYVSAACDPSGFGEGKTFLAQKTVTTDGAGRASFEKSVPTALAAGKQITATAMAPDGDTSEFSRCRTVTAP